ncbi:amino acid ABC transporter permease [Labrys neptuniae]
MSSISLPDAARQPSGQRWQTLKSGLFSSPLNTAITLIVLALVAWVGSFLIDWAFIRATWSGTAQDCQANGGACWAFVGANLKLMLFWTYPPELIWRPILSLVLMFGLAAISTVPRFWGRSLALAWIAVPVVTAMLLRGYFSGIVVSTNDWGGLPLTMLMWTVAYASSFLIAIPLALGRRSGMGGVRLVSTGFIEIVRGMPMLVVLYVSSLIVPMALPYFDVNLFFSVEVALTLFIASYLAEVIRAGMQALPAGQTEAARALGLSYWQTTGLVVLPQALRTTIPPLVNLGIGVLLSTPLIGFIGMIDFLTAVRNTAATSEQIWPHCYPEAYAFAALIYFLICFPASRYSLWLERRLKASTSHQAKNG